MTDCEGGRLCVACHPLRHLGVCVGIVLVYLGFLWVILWWLP